MTKALNDLSVTEAASLALEVLIFNDYLEDKKGKYEWSTPYEGTFEQYLIDYVFDGEDEVYDREKEDYVSVSEVSMPSLDNDHVWQSLHNENKKGTRDNLTAKVEKSHGGEGEGDQYWMVISVSDGLTTRYFRKDGWYASYDGGYLDGDTCEVNPVEKVVTFFE